MFFVLIISLLKRTIYTIQCVSFNNDFIQRMFKGRTTVIIKLYPITWLVFPLYTHMFYHWSIEPYDVLTCLKLNTFLIVIVNLASILKSLFPHRHGSMFLRIFSHNRTFFFDFSKKTFVLLTFVVLHLLSTIICVSPDIRNRIARVHFTLFYVVID